MEIPKVTELCRGTAHPEAGRAAVRLPLGIRGDLRVVRPGSTQVPLPAGRRPGSRL